MFFYMFSSPGSEGDVKSRELSLLFQHLQRDLANDNALESCLIIIVITCK